MIIFKPMRLSEVIYRNPSVVPVIGRFGIRLGVGDKTIAETAREAGIDEDFFLLVLNTYLNEDYFPEDELYALSRQQVDDYLAKTDRYYLQVQLPNIERHLNAFIGRSLAGCPAGAARPGNLPGPESGNPGMPAGPENPETREHPQPGFAGSGTCRPGAAAPAEHPFLLLRKLLGAFRQALESRIGIPAGTPEIPGNPGTSGRPETYVGSEISGGPETSARPETSGNTETSGGPEEAAGPDPSPEQLLAEMQHIMIRFLQGPYDENLCYATLFALRSMETDLRRHDRIRGRILRPVAEAEKSGRRAVPRTPETRENRSLTAREREVLILIAKGYSNKEIARRLYISFQTVLTHRKNITSKLGIRTVSGLTFYTIMNGLV